MRAVRFVLFGNACKTFRHVLDPTSSRDFLNSTRAAELPVVFLVRAADLGALRRFGDVVVDRGVKSDSKALSYYLLNQSKPVPILVGGHTKKGQLARSIRALLRNAQSGHVRKAFVLGVVPELADSFYDEAEAAAVDAPTPVDLVIGETVLDPTPEPEPQGLINMYRGDAQVVRTVRQLVLRAGRHDRPLLLIGETGTGRSLIARAIHENSSRAGRPFERYDCAAAVEDFIDADLFGDETVTKETGAPPARGLFERADGGTVQLAGITELSQMQQRKVLRVINHQRIRRVGALQDTNVNVRVIASTSRDLHHLVERDQFDSRLYDAIRRHAIRTPPLREHKSDLPEYAQFYWRFYTGDENAVLGPELIEELADYYWPENMRGLKTVLRLLYEASDSKDPELKQFKSIILFRGQTLGSDQVTLDEADESIRWIQCVEHLRRAKQIVDSCKFAMTNILEGHAGDEFARIDIHDVARHLGDLDALFNQPMMFSSPSTYRLVHRLHGTMRVQFQLMHTSLPDAMTFWNTSMKDKFTPVTLALGDELKSVVAGRCNEDAWGVSATSHYLDEIEYADSFNAGDQGAATDDAVTGGTDRPDHGNDQNEEEPGYEGPLNDGPAVQGE